MRVLRAELRLAGITGIGTTTAFPFFLQTHARVEELIQDTGYAEMYPILKGEDVAERIVRGMLRGEVEIAIPGFFMIIYRFITYVILLKYVQKVNFYTFFVNEIAGFCRHELRIGSSLSIIS